MISVCLCYVITIVQRYAKSTVFTLVITHTRWFLWLLDLEHEPKQLEASPPQQSGLQLEYATELYFDHTVF